MTDFPNRPKQDHFETVLAQEINSSQTSGVYLNAVPDYSTGGETVRIVILNPKGIENITVTGWSSVTKLLSGVTRGVASYDGGASTARAHPAGTKVLIGSSYKHLEDIDTALLSKVDLAGDTMTGLLQWSGTSHAGIKVNSLTTAQRDALGAPANGNIIYNTTAGEFQMYQGGSWVTISSGSTQPDASTTVAGKVEIATQSENNAGTVTGGTGASLVATPNLNAVSVQDAKWVYAADSVGTDAYAITLVPAVAAYATGQKFHFLAGTANTGACTLNVNGLGAKTIKKHRDQDTETGDIEANQIVTVVYDGTNFQMQSQTAQAPILSTLLDAKGDIVAASADNTPAKVTVGANETVLVADSAQTAGVKWAVRPQIFVGQFTRTSATGTGNQVVTGVGFTPRLIELVWSYTDPTDNTVQSGFGMATSTSNEFSCGIYVKNAVAPGAPSGTTIITAAAGDGNWTGDLTAIGSDGFTIAFTKSSDPSDIVVTYKCLA